MKRIIYIDEQLFDMLRKSEYLSSSDERYLIRAVANSRPCEDWIPVKERLPEEDGVYLVTLEYVEDSEIVNEIDIAKFVYSEKDDCNDGFHKAYPVIAWRPLPEVYMEGL